MNNFVQISYALQRQKRAVERTLSARSTEECVVASRWVDAWHRLVQAKLDQVPPAPSQRTSQLSSYVDLRRGQFLH